MSRNDIDIIRQTGKELESDIEFIELEAKETRKLSQFLDEAVDNIFTKIDYVKDSLDILLRKSEKITTDASQLRENKITKFIEDRDWEKLNDSQKREVLDRDLDDYFDFH